MVADHYTRTLFQRRPAHDIDPCVQPTPLISPGDRSLALSVSDGVRLSSDSLSYVTRCCGLPWLRLRLRRGGSCVSRRAGACGRPVSSYRVERPGTACENDDLRPVSRSSLAARWRSYRSILSRFCARLCRMYAKSPVPGLFLLEAADSSSLMGEAETGDCLLDMLGRRDSCLWAWAWAWSWAAGTGACAVAFEGVMKGVCWESRRSST